MYGGEYLIQVWDDNKNLIFERVRSKEIKTWSLSNNTFVFLEDLDQLRKLAGQVDVAFETSPAED